MFEQVLDFFAEKARGLILTVTGAGVGNAAGVLERNIPSPPEAVSLDELQRWVFIASLVVAILTTISYLYKFYQLCKNRMKHKI